MSPSYYVAFILDRDITNTRQRVIIEAGVDLLAGPFATRELAQQAVRDACQAHARLAAFAALASAIAYGTAYPPARIDVIPITRAMVDDYNAQHALAFPWPLPVLAPVSTNTPDKYPKKSSARQTTTVQTGSATRSRRKGEPTHVSA